MHSPDRIVLKPSPINWIGMAAGSMAFICIGIWMLRSGEPWAWLIIVFFGICLTIALVNLLPNASYLELTPDGFTMCSLFRSHTFKWTDVSEFGVVRVLTNKMVMFNFNPSYKPSSKLRTFNVGIVGYEAGIPDNYGLKHEELAELLNKFKASSHGA